MAGTEPQMRMTVTPLLQASERRSGNSMWADNSAVIEEEMQRLRAQVHGRRAIAGRRVIHCHKFGVRWPCNERCVVVDFEEVS